MLSPSPSHAVVDLAERGQKIAAIKLYRRESGLGLADAKAIVDSIECSLSTSTPRQPSANRASRHAALFLCATILGLAGTGITGTGAVRALLAESWPQASGEILVVRRSARTHGHPPRVEVKYEFEVDGERYVGDRISYTAIWGSFFTESTYNRYIKGRAVDVSYDPSNPTRSVLETRIPTVYLLTLCCAILSLLWGTKAWRAAAIRERTETMTSA